MTRWTPDQGPLEDALADLPAGHEVTVTVPVYLAVAMTGCATSASWLPAQPAWDGALVVLDATDDLLWRGVDGLYRSGSVGDSDACTAAEIEANWPPVTVLVDADHRYVEVPHA